MLYLNPVSVIFFSSLFLCNIIIEVSAITIRVRLSDGTFKRVELEEKSSVVSIRNALKSQGIIGSETKLSYKSELLREGTHVIELKAGEIIDVIEDTVTVKQSQACETNATIVSSSPSLKTNRVVNRVKRGAASMAEMKKRKQEMLKIAPQKPPTNRAVNVAPSVARILNR